MFKILVICAIAWVLFSSIVNRGPSAPSVAAQSSSNTTAGSMNASLSSLDQLEQAQVSALAPTGELAEMFKFGTDSTDLQRQLKFKEINGSIIDWKLPVYDVKQSGDDYIIQTSSDFRGDLMKDKVIGTFLRISPRSEDDRRYIERLKTGDVVQVKGIIKNITMRNLDISPAIIVVDVPTQLLFKVYGNYNADKNCWLTFDQDRKQRFCMKVGRVDRKKLNGDNKYYVLALGAAIEANGEETAGRFTKGLAGIFVVDTHDRQIKIDASNSAIPLGQFGSPPQDWDLIQLGASEYWGWMTKTNDIAQGSGSYKYRIFAPHGQQISELTERVLAEVREPSDDAGLNEVSVVFSLKVDTSDSSKKIFPLILTRSGKFKEKQILEQTWKLSFDETKWAYVTPKLWPPFPK